MFVTYNLMTCALCIKSKNILANYIIRDNFIYCKVIVFKYFNPIEKELKSFQL